MPSFWGPEGGQDAQRTSASYYGSYEEKRASLSSTISYIVSTYVPKDARG